MKKAQISSQVFVYILAAVIIGIILLVGYRAINTVLNVTNKAPIDNFKTEFSSNVNRMSRDFGSVKKYQFSLSKSFDEICFIDSMNENEQFDISASVAINSFIRYNIEDNVQKNVFLLYEDGVDESFYVENLDVADDYLCIKNEGLMEVWFEGIGRNACLKKTQTESC